MIRDSVLVILPLGGSLSKNVSMLSISSSVVGVTASGCSWGKTKREKNSNRVYELGSWQTCIFLFKTTLLHCPWGFKLFSNMRYIENTQSYVDTNFTHLLFLHFWMPRSLIFPCFPLKYWLTIIRLMPVIDLKQLKELILTKETLSDTLSSGNLAPPPLVLSRSIWNEKVRRIINVFRFWWVPGAFISHFNLGSTEALQFHKQTSDHIILELVQSCGLMGKSEWGKIHVSLLYCGESCPWAGRCKLFCSSGFAHQPSVQFSGYTGRPPAVSLW